MQIEWGAGQFYEPDFVVETKDEKWVVEVKRRDELTNDDVVAKAKAASEWAGHASDDAAKHGGEPWPYLLIPHDAVDGASLSRLRQTCVSQAAPAAEAAE